MNNTNTFFTAIFGFLILGERISLALGICMLGCFCGIVLLNVYQPKVKESQNFDHFTWGMVAALIFVTCFALVNVLNRKLKLVHYSVIQFNVALSNFAYIVVMLLVEFLVKSPD